MNKWISRCRSIAFSLRRALRRLFGKLCRGVGVFRPRAFYCNGVWCDSYVGSLICFATNPLDALRDAAFARFARPRFIVCFGRKAWLPALRQAALLIGPVAQWIRHRPTEPGIAGSSPAGVILVSGAETLRNRKRIVSFWPQLAKLLMRTVFGTARVLYLALGISRALREHKNLEQVRNSSLRLKSDITVYLFRPSLFATLFVKKETS